MQDFLIQTGMLNCNHTDFDMLVSLVGDPLINLITEAQTVMFNTEVSNHLKLISSENL